MDEFADINITPFTDILLVLPIIFMIMAMVVVPAGFEQQFGCNCGNATTKAASIFRTALTVEADGRMVLDGTPITARSIYAAMQRLHARHRTMALDIFAGADAPYGEIIRAMDAAKAADITNVTFATM